VTTVTDATIEEVLQRACEETSNAEEASQAGRPEPREGKASDFAEAPKGARGYTWQSLSFTLRQWQGPKSTL